MSINNGGPAFPIPGLQHDEDFNGMTLRDYFAAKAMQAFNANPDFTNDNVRKIAELAYLQADEMLKAREVQS
ncbi:hypothetical protein [Pseudomonas sp. GM_Psu_2]|uniref:hypothetical protein n=1 Tax=unclassified Pseudomonas TaxID=196821 RepID=UPI002269BF13|nr:hypothetical protein [Pseudomonas sp. GM_Psu_2]